MPQYTETMHALVDYATIGSDYGLSLGTKQLSEPVLTVNYSVGNIFK